MSKTKADVVLSNLAQLDSKETTDAMQAFFNQFHLGTKNVEQDAMMISDSMVAISKNMAMNFSQGIREMINGVKVSGLVAKNAGFDLQHYEALIGTVAQVTRASGEEIGNAYKTILSRMGAVKPATKKAAQDINRVETALKKVGVQLRSDKDTFRNSGDVLDDLSKKWGNLSQAQKAEIAEKAAGINQINKFYALMDNYGKYTELATKATHSQGEAMKANEIYLQSTEAKMKLLTNAMQEFFGAALKSNDLKVLIEALTDIVHVATVVVDKFGLLGTVAGIMGTKMIMSSNGFKNLITEMKSTNNVIGTLSGKFSNFGNSLKVDKSIVSLQKLKSTFSNLGTESHKSIANVIKSANGGQVAIKKWNGEIKSTVKSLETVSLAGKKLGIVKQSFTNISTGARTAKTQIMLLGKAFDVARIKATLFQAVASMGISLAIGAIVSGIGKLISKANEGKKSLSDMVSTLSDKSSQISNLDGLANKLDYLSNKTHRNKEEQKQLEQVQQQIAQQNPSLITGYDNYGKAIVNNGKAVRELVKEKRNLLEAELASKLVDQKDNIDKKINENKKAQKAMAGYKDTVDRCRKAKEKYGKSNYTVNESEKRARLEMGKQAKTIRENEKEINNYKSAESALNKIHYDSARAIIDNINANKKHKMSIEEATKALKDQGVDAKTLQGVIADYKQNLRGAADGNKDMKGSIDDANQSLAEQGDKLAGLNGKIEFYKKVLQEFKDNDGNLTRSTLDQIIQKNQELIPLLKDKAHFEGNMKKAIDDTSKAHDSQVQKIVQGSGSIKDALASIGDTAKKTADETGSEVSKIAQQTSDSVKQSSEDASNKVSSDSDNTKKNVSGDMDETANKGEDTGGKISDSSSKTSGNVNDDSANTRDNVKGDMDDTAGKADEAGGSISDTADTTSGNVQDASGQAAQGMADSMDGAVNAMAQAYGVDLGNFGQACNEKIRMANEAASQIASAFNAVYDQMRETTAGLINSDSYVNHEGNLTFTNPAKTFRDQQDDKYKNIMSGWAKAAQNMPYQHIETHGGGGVGIAGGGYSPQGSSHSAGGGGGRHRRGGSGGSGGGGRSPRHSTGGGGSGSGRHKNGGSGGSSGGSSGGKGGSSETKKDVENLKLEIDRYKLINGEISSINEKLNRTRDLKEQAKGKGKVGFINKEID